MPIVPCGNIVVCEDCYDPPLANLSAEAIDHHRFLPRVPVVITQPPIGSWSAQSCLIPGVGGMRGQPFICWSDISQADADACAQALLPFCLTDGVDPGCLVPPCPPDPPPCDVPPCLPDPNPCPVPPCPPGDDGWVNSVIYKSIEQKIDLVCPNGSLFTYILPAGAKTSTVNQDTADLLALNLAWQNAQTLKFCFTSPNLLIICKNTDYTFTFSATGGTGPLTFTIDPTQLLVGSTLFGATLSGNQAWAGAFDMQVVCTDSSIPPRQITQVFTLYVLEITSPSPLPSGNIVTAYSQILASTPAGLGIWSLTAGSLPPGLTLNANTGIISGMPTLAGTFPFTIGLTA